MSYRPPLALGLKPICAWVGQIVFWLWLAVGPMHGQFTYSEDFKNDTAAGWNFFQGNTTPGPRLTSGAAPQSGDPEFGGPVIDAAGQGWLRLVTDTGNQANAVFFDTPIPSAGNQVTVQFGANMWGGNNFGGTGADGLTFFMYDASQSFAPGAFGGSIGYANRTGVDGLGGGFMGISFDVYGNFSNPTEGRNGGVGFVPNAVVARGPGSGQTGYNYLAGTSGSSGPQGRNYTDTGDPTALDAGDGVVPALPYIMGSPLATERPNQSTQYRNVSITLDENSQVLVRMQFGEDGLWYDVLNFDLSSFVRPEQLRIGFASGTGGGTMVYEIGRTLQITASLGTGNFIWDNQEDSDFAAGIWGTSATNPLNWAGNTNPTLRSNVIFNSAFIDQDQSIDLQGSDKVIRNLFLSGPNAYTVNTSENRRLIFESESPTGLTTISLTNEAIGNAAHTINVDVQMNRVLDINNNITPTFTINGGIDNGGNDLNLKGVGTTILNGAISGTGDLFKFDSGTTILGGATANTYTGATTINAGTLQIEKATALGSTAAGTTVNAGGTLALAGSGTIFAAEGLTLNGAGFGGQGALRNLNGDNTWTGTITLASAASIGAEAGTSLNVSGVITGAAANDLTKTGAGTLILAGANTYAGATTVQGGVLQISSQANLGVNPASFTGGQLTLNGGTLRTAGADVTLNANNRGVTIGATGGTFDAQTNLQITTAVAGAGDLVKLGSGNLTLAGANTHSGDVSIQTGTLTAVGGSAIGNSSTVDVAAGAIFNTTANNETIGALAGAGQVELGASTLTLGGNNASTTFAGVASGTGGITKEGTGELILSGANTYTGTTRVNAGTVTLGTANVFADSSTLALAGGTFAVGGNYSETFGGLSLLANSTLNFNQATSALTFTNASRTAGVLTVDNWAGDFSGGGLSQFITANTPTGFGANDIVFAGYGPGYTRLASGEIVPVTGTVYTWNATGGTWADQNHWESSPDGFPGGQNHVAIFGDAITSPLTLSLGANRTLGYVVFNDDNNVTLQNNTLNFNVSAGDAFINAQNAGNYTISSAVSLSSNTLQINQNGTGTLTLAGTISNASGTNNLVVAGTGNTTISGNINTGGGSLTKLGEGTLTLTGNKAFTGGVNITEGVVSVNSVANAGTNRPLGNNGTITLGGADTTGTLRYTSGSNQSTNRNHAIAAGGGIIDVTNAATTLTISSVLAGAGALEKVGPGSLTLSGTGTNTHTGDITVSGGTLNINKTGGANRGIGDNALVTVNSGAALRFQGGQGETIGSLAGNGTLTNISTAAITLTTGGNNQSTTFSGTLTNGAQALNLTKNGTGTFTLAGNNTHTGTTTVNAGTLVAASSTALGTTAAGTTVASGATLGLQGDVAIGAEALTLSGTGQGGNGALRNLQDDNSLAGAITLNANTRIQSDTGTLTLSGNINGNAAGRTLTFGGAGNTTATGNIQGNVSTLTQSGTGTLTLSGNNAYTGVTTVSSGTLVAAGNNALGTTAAGTTIAAGATLAVTGGITTAEAITLNGQGAGNLGALRSLAGTNQLDGNLTLAGESSIGVAAGSTLTSTGVISGTGFGVTLTGDGTLVLTGNNTYSGTTAVQSGVLEVRANNALGTTAAPTTVSDGATLRFHGTGLTITENITLAGAGVGGQGGLANPSGNNTLSGNVAMTANSAIGATAGTALTVTGTVSGDHNLVKVGAGDLTLDAVNSYTGSTTVRAGILRVGVDAPSGTTGALGNATSIVQLGDGGTSADDFGLLTIGGGGLTVGRAIVVNNVGGTATLGGANTAGTDTYTGTITLNRDLTLAATSAAGTVAFTGPVAGNGDITVSGPGTVRLAGPNTYSGETTVASGTLVAASHTALGTTAAGTSVTAGATLALTGGVDLGAEAFTLAGAGAGGVGAIRNLDGDNRLGGALTATGATTLGASAGTLTIDGVVSGNQNLTTAGAGDIVFTATNTLSGTLTVSAGTTTLANTGGEAFGSVGAVVVDNATLALGAANQINDSANLTLTNGGIINLGSFSDTLRTLTVANSGRIDYLNDGAALTFNGDGSVNGLAGAITGTLSIDNWAGSLAGNGNEQLIVRSTTNIAGTTIANLNFADWGTGDNNNVLSLGGGLYEIVPLITGVKWGLNGDGAWNNNGGNWRNSDTGAIANQPNAVGAIAILGDYWNGSAWTPLTADPTITVTGDRVVGKLIFENSTNRDYTIDGGGYLDFNSATGPAQIIVNDHGSHRITSGTPGYVLSDLVVTNYSSATAGLTIDSGYQVRTAPRTLTFNGTGTTVVNGVISQGGGGVGSLVKTGAGTLELNAANTYTGTSTLRAGTLVLNNTSALGNATSTVTLNDGATAASAESALLLGSAITFSRNLQVNAQGDGTTLGGTHATGTSTFSGTTTLNRAVNLTAAPGGTVDFTGQLTAGTGSQHVTVTGGGVVQLTNTANNYNGATNITAGTLRLGNSEVLPNGTAVSISSGATLDLNNFNETIGSLAGDAGATVTLPGATNRTLTTGGNNATTTYAGTITDSGTGVLSLVKTGTGTMTLSGDNSYRGATTVSAGTLIAAHHNALGQGLIATATDDTTVAAGATLGLIGNITIPAGEFATLASSVAPTTDSLVSLAGNNTWQGNVALTGTDTVRLAATAGATLTITGVVSGPSTLAKTGGGTVVLSGNNTYTGTTNITAGTLVAASDNALGTTAGGTAVQIGATLGLQGNITIPGGETVTLAGAGSPTTPSLRNLSGTNTLAGPITLTGGVNTGVLIDTNAGSSLTLSGQISQATNANSITKTGSGTLTLSGTAPNTFTGNFTINDGTVIAAKTAGLDAFGTGNLAIGDTIGAANSAILTLGANNQIADTSNITIQRDGRFDLTAFSDTIGALTLTGGEVIGTGTLTVSDNITFNGTGTSTATIASNLNLGGNRTIQVGNNGINGDQDLTFSGVISGIGHTLTKTDLGTLRLTGTAANSYTGGTVITDGTIELAKTAGVSALGTGNITVGDDIGPADSAVLTWINADQIDDNARISVLGDGRLDLLGLHEVIGSLEGSGTVNITGAGGRLVMGGDDTSTTFTGSLIGDGFLEKTGTGVFTLGSAVNFAGTIELAAGTLRLADITATVGTLRITGDTVLDFAGTSILNVGTLIVDPGVSLSVINWIENDDFFFASNWTGATYDTQGANPMSQITFQGFSNNQTVWLSYDDQVTVPEPGTYGLTLTGALLAWLGLRRRPSRTELGA